MKRSVIFFSDSFPPIVDGVAHVVLNYAQTLGEMGWDCTVVAPDAPGASSTEKLQTFRYFSLPLPGRYPYRIGIPKIDLQLYKGLEKIRSDIVHVHGPFSSGRLGLDFSRKRRIPVVGTFHSQYAYDFKSALRIEKVSDKLLILVARFYESLDHVWVPNDFAGKTLQGYGYRGTYQCVPNGTDFNKEDDLKVMREEGSVFLKVRPEEFILMFAGRLVKEKNLLFLCEIMDKLVKQRGQCRLIFIGEGYYSGKLKQFTIEHNLSKHISFTGPIYDRSRLKCCMARADLFLMPSLYDISSLTVQEAAALAVPIIFLTGSPTSEKVQHGINGFLCPNDTDSWASMITGLMARPDQLLAVGMKGQEDLVNPWPVVMKMVESLYIDYIRRAEES